MNEIGLGMNDIEATTWIGARPAEPQRTSMTSLFSPQTLRAKSCKTFAMKRHDLRRIDRRTGTGFDYHGKGKCIWRQSHQRITIEVENREE